MFYERPRFLAGGDKAFFIEFGNAITPELSRRVRHLLLAIQNARIPGVIETVPTYRSLLIYYDPLATSPLELRARLETLAGSRLTQDGVLWQTIIHCVFILSALARSTVIGFWVAMALPAFAASSKSRRSSSLVINRLFFTRPLAKSLEAADAIILPRNTKGKSSFEATIKGYAEMSVNVSGCC